MGLNSPRALFLVIFLGQNEKDIAFSLRSPIFMKYVRERERERACEWQNNLINIYESFCSATSLILAMCRACSTRRSGYKEGDLPEEGVSPGQTRPCISRGNDGPGPRMEQSARPQEADGPQGMFPCHKCQASIPYATHRVVIRPCGHEICTFCCIVSHVEWGCTPHTCPIFWVHLFFEPIGVHP